MDASAKYLNDLQLLDLYCDQYFDHTPSSFLRELEIRGLLDFIDNLPNNPSEAKAVIHTRLARVNRYFEDAEIDQVANEIHRMEQLREEINKIEVTEVHKTAPLIDEFQFINQWLLDYFKPSSRGS